MLGSIVGFGVMCPTNPAFHSMLTTFSLAVVAGYRVFGELSQPFIPHLCPSQTPFPVLPQSVVSSF